MCIVSSLKNRYALHPKGTSCGAYMVFTYPSGIYSNPFSEVIKVDELVKSPNSVTPAKAGVQKLLK
jgi:hypothetical protein